MLALINFTVWHWVGFVIAVLFFLALDLGVFHRHAHVVKFKEALTWTAIWFTLSMAFAGLMIPAGGKTEAIEFLTGYIIELSLSMDNVFVIALIFTYFRVPLEYQHRVLFWGILGALIMRGIMIGLGAALIARFHWMLYVFGGFLILTGIKMIFSDEQGVHPEKNIFIRIARRFFPISQDFCGQSFATRLNGAFALTPLALVLLMVETTDLIFAVDSIPAIFAVTQKPFIVFTSNVFAILGLRSLYFVLAGAIGYFRYLKFGLSVVLVFIGAKMLVDPHNAEMVVGATAHPQEKLLWFQIDIPTWLSLVVVAGVILASILFSVVAAKRHSEAEEKTPAPR
jgi:tellurite resistance protein TerC